MSLFHLARTEALDVGDLVWLKARQRCFLGDGRPCLVWSSGLQADSISYLALSEGELPRLLLAVDNGLGQEIRLKYASSGAHYLRDGRDGRPWRTKLPFHRPDWNSQDCRAGAEIDVDLVRQAELIDRATREFQIHPRSRVYALR